MIIHSWLHDDLKSLIAGFSTNEGITQAQRAVWSHSGHGHAITQAHFSNTHPNALRLLKEDGYDGGLVINGIRPKSARAIFNYDTTHKFLEPEDALRVGQFFGLSPICILLLMLKAAWERHLLYDHLAWRTGQAPVDLASDLGQTGLREALESFDPDHASFAAMFVPPDSMTQHKQYSKHLSISALTLCRQRLFLSSLTCEEVTVFDNREKGRLDQVMHGSEEKQRDFSMLRTTHLAKLDELDDINLAYESLRAHQAETHRRWMVTFGDVYLPYQQARLTLMRLDLRLRHLGEDPDLSPDELEMVVINEEMQILGHVREEEVRCALAPGLAKEGSLYNSELPSGDLALVAERNVARGLLRRIYRLLHPDHLMHHEAYRKLTNDQQRELQKMLHAALEIRPEDIGYADGHLYTQMRSIQGLQYALDRIERILANAGLSLDLQLEPDGETLDQQMTWLRRELERIEADLLEARTRLACRLADEEARQHAEILKNVEDHTEVRASYREQTRQLHDGIAERVEHLRDRGYTIPADLSDQDAYHA